jgi:acyl transferase domain-containing protein/NAD(P)H-dependent flavin oxidoreductase YrpB (nitropropane dioxygenase family)/NAD(P)-dependent dehydrogenase (short-subunit alcohol dehydrogenase family)
MTAAQPFTIAVSNVSGWNDSGPAVAAARSGAAGILNLEHIGGAEVAAEMVARALVLARRAKGELGVRIAACEIWAADFLRSLPDEIAFVVVIAGESANHADLTAAAGARRCLLEVTSSTQAAGARESGFSALIAKGHEAGGYVGEESTFVLLQRLLAEHHLPVWAMGGIGLHSAAACFAGGAAGVVLDSQVLLTPESSIPAPVRAALSRPDGGETICLGQEIGPLFRVYRQPGGKAIRELEALEQRLNGPQGREEWRNAIESAAGWGSPDLSVWPLGQDAAFARSLVDRFDNVAGILDAMHEAVREHARLAAEIQPLAPGSALAVSHGTEYPILQGPMTRVSDKAAFANFVAKEGGLPFLALALLRGPQVRELLEEAARLLGALPWGVGILGFVPAELREEQLAVVREYRPPYAIIAGGRPDQAHSLEQLGIKSYLHVPTPNLLRGFVEDGSRRFIFEGRECGGHVGPKTSFVLWDSMLEELLALVERGVPAQELHIVFAGGIHDARSAAMVAALAAPLAAKGARIGVLMGTAYLFTEEAVQGGAIVEEFQKQAVECRQTVLLHSGPGHSTRCAETPFFEAFRSTRRELLAAGKSVEEVKSALEDLNLGRLRIASKGLVRQGDALAEVARQEQLEQGMYMIGQVAALRSGVSKIRDVHEAVSAGSVRVLDALPIAEDARAKNLRGVPPPCDVAIVGMSCLLPGAPNIEAFWSNVLSGVDAITDVPGDRFDLDTYFSEDKKARDAIYSRKGGFVADVPFDPMRYGIPPNSLASIDPLQLLMLVTVDEALRDAGYHRRKFARERTSVVLGFSGGLGELGVNYAVRSSLAQFATVPPEVMERLPEWTEDSFPGILPNVAAGRVANRFDFAGVNFNVDAACASSLAAVYVAARELASGASDMVVTGGIDSGQNPFGYLCFSRVTALSGRGHCSTFDKSADGIAISEGVSVVVLKRLEDAERDGDRIYAVIRGVAGSSDGRGRSMTAPRPEGQIVALRRAYEQAGFSPSTVGLIEAHGTGTVAGDASELASLMELFKDANAVARTCAVGSVKSMIGHTKAAAGVTGLIKAALALHQHVLPPTLNVTDPNPKLLESGSPFYLNTEAQPWAANGAPRRAGVSAFGFGGSNFHAVLEEYRDDIRHSAQTEMSRQWPSELFFWTAPDKAALVSALENTARQISGARCDFTSLASAVCSSASYASRSSGLRLAVVASSLAELQDRIAAAKQALLENQDSLRDAKRGIYLGTGPLDGKVAFLFPGQGSQYPGMLRELAVRMPEFRDMFASADKVLPQVNGFPFSRTIYPGSTFTDEEKNRLMSALTETDVAQPALGVVDTATYKLLERLGIHPDMTAGHSYGEYVALHAAGVLSEEAMLLVSRARGRAIRESISGDAGAMAAIAAIPQKVSEALAKFPDVTIANYNGPLQTIIAGPTAAVLEAVKHFENMGVDARRVPVACAFHTPLMENAAKQFNEFLAATEFQPAQLPVFSNTLAQAYPEDPTQVRELLSQHMVNPVRFSAQIEAMFADGARVFIEAGPKTVLSGLARQVLKGKPVHVLPMDGGAKGGFSHFVHALAHMVALGLDLDLAAVFAGRVREKLDLQRLNTEQTRAGWMLNPSRVYNPAQPPALKAPVRLVTEGTVIQQVTSAVETLRVDAPRTLAPRLETPAPVATQHVADVAGADSAILQFQNLMGQFLQTQSAVMTAYLQTISGLPTPAAFTMPAVTAPPAPPVVPMYSAPVTQPPTPQPPAPHQVIAVAPAPAPVLTPLITKAEQRDLRGDLLRIVAARTGYPVEMLALDAAMEADLGIDSIKKVEILAEFRRQFSASEQDGIRAIMETLTSASTLGQIIERVTAAIGEPVKAASPVPTAVSQTSPVPSTTRDFAADLLRIVAARTGYPIEMLALDAAIEADLGIDSIKKVEILAEFRRQFSASEQESLRAVMDKLTSAQTFQQIIDHVRLALGTNAPTATLPVATAALAVSAAPSFDIAGALLRIASARTGYPADMLAMDADLEADLGIDSIKRVEIIGELRRSMPEADQDLVRAVIDQLTTSRTLQQIYDKVTAALQPTASKPVAPPATKAVPQFRLSAIECPPAHSNSAHAGRVTIITDDETGLAADLAAELASRGERPVLLRHGVETTLATDGVYCTDLSDAALVADAVRQIGTVYGPIGGVVHLLPLREKRDWRELPLDAWRKHVQLDVKSLYALVQAAEGDLRKRGKANGALVAAITGRGGQFGIESSTVLDPGHFAVADFVKTLSLELDGVRCRVVDVDTCDGRAILRRKIMDELASDEDTLQIGLPGDRRLTVTPRFLGSEGRDRVKTPDSSWVFLLTGGARGITAEIAKTIAQRYQSRMILVGASELPQKESADTASLTDASAIRAVLLERLRSGGKPVKPAQVEAAYQRLSRDREISRNLAEIAEAGAPVEYHSVDVRDETAFSSLIDRTYARFGRIDVVIHGAGIIEDKLIRDKTPASFDRVVHTKADSSFILLHKLRFADLKCLVFMSSISAALGNRGQADYAAANGIMNGIASTLAAENPGLAVALNWGPWDRAGMVSESVREQFLVSGVQLIDCGEGVRVVLDAIETGETCPLVVVGDGPWSANALHAARVSAVGSAS